MKLYDLVNPDDLEEAIEDRLINVRHSADGYHIYNYSDKAMYTPGAWENAAVRTCRGLIVDPHYNVVARPWSKFFNWGQVEAGELDLLAPVEVTDKADGFLAILWTDQDTIPYIASRGSFESEHAKWGTKLFREKYWETFQFAPGFTFLFEGVAPQFRIVLDYNNTQDLILLGAVNVGTGKYYGPQEAQDMCGWTGPVTKVFPYKTLKEALEAPSRPNAEGMCVRFLNENRIVKIKQEDYVRLHKIVCGLSEKSVWEHMYNKAQLSALLDTLPDELVEWTAAIWGDLTCKYDQILYTALYKYMDVALSLPKGFTQKDFALAVQDLPNKHLLFKIHADKRIHEDIMKMIKPVVSKQFKEYSEDVA